jgi:hypothetical protein
MPQATESTEFFSIDVYQLARVLTLIAHHRWRLGMCSFHHHQGNLAAGPTLIALIRRGKCD